MMYTEKVKKIVGEAERYFDWDYVLEVVKKLSSFGDNSLGFRLAGGPAERRAAEYIARELEGIGCKEVILEEVPVDKWILKEAFVEIKDKNLRITGVTYAGYPPSKVEGLLAYIGRGTLEYYKDLDVKNKIVLLELRDDLTNSPLPYFKEASNRGAVGIIATYLDKVAEGKQDTLFTADGEYFDGLPPVIYISPRDFQLLKEIYRREEQTIILRIDSHLSDGYGLNVIGHMSRGSRYNIIVSAHHDAHFKGVIDDASGVALMLLLARSIKDLNIDKDLYFISFTAEEFGCINTSYDYLIGSHYFFKKHSDIVSRNWLFINLDGIGVSGGSVGLTYTPELETFILDLVTNLAGEVSSGFNLMSRPSLWLDQWPAVYNGLSSVALTNLGHKEFFQKYYHTQYDDIDLLNKTTFRDYYFTSYILLRSFSDAKAPYYDFSDS